MPVGLLTGESFKFLHYRGKTAGMTGAAELLELGLAAHRAGDLHGAARYYQRAIETEPNLLQAYVNYGFLLTQAGAPDKAADVYRRALGINPDYVGALVNYGGLLRDRGQAAKALPYLERAAALAPDSLDALGNLGNAFKDVGRLDEAISAYRQALDAAPNSPALHNNIGIVRQKLGDIKTAISSFQRAIELRPRAANPYRNLLSALLFAPETTEADVYAEARRFGQLFSRPEPAPAYANSWDPSRRIRLGFVSSDFHDHPVARNLIPILSAIDRTKVEIFIYADAGVRDTVTDECMKLADRWQEITGTSDAAAARLIHSDQIDVLFLLASRYDRNRPLIATFRPAPVQVSFHDPATSGLDSIDYLIADPVLVPRSARRYFTERVVCLPSFYIHAPLLASPDVGLPPFERNGFITFGSCNKPSKLNDTVVGNWAAILNRVPKSRLILKYRNQFSSPLIRARIARIFADAGVDPTRIDMKVEMESFTNHLKTFSEMDIALDTYPFTGSTTTFEALWMGVPVVTRRGATMASRWGASILHALGLEELVADSEVDYIDLAATLAADPRRQAALRRSLRDRVMASALCDGRAAAAHFTRLVQALWRRRCKADGK